MVKRTARAPARKTKPAAKPKKRPAAKKKRPAPASQLDAPSVDAPDAPRRAVFIDVENTSNESELARAIDGLRLDENRGVTQVSAIGNWRAVGQQLARTLAERGAVLVHSAPVARIRDWSDLWIAVQAGIWLGRARPGDVIEIISHDKAFDAVGDAAAQLGVVFRRITYRPGAVSERGSEAPLPATRPRRRRGSGGFTARPLQPRPLQPRAEQPPIATPARAPDEEAPHGASPQELLAAVARLVAASPTGVTTLDALTNALKAAGFTRPPGSPRLVTRLRQLAELEVSPGGKLRLRNSPAPASADTPSLPGPTEERRPRRRRRGGRRRSGGGGGALEAPQDA